MRFAVPLRDPTLPAPRTEKWAWQIDGACRDKDSNLFFDNSESLSVGAQAKRICSGCPVLEQCREYAVDAAEPYGVWGGLTPPERERVRRQRKWFTPARVAG